MTWDEAVLKMAEWYKANVPHYANNRYPPPCELIGNQKPQADCSGFVTACLSYFAGLNTYKHTSTAGMLPDGEYAQWMKSLGFGVIVLTPEQEAELHANKQPGVPPSFFQPWDIIRHSQDGYGGPGNGHTYIIGPNNTRYEMGNGPSSMGRKYWNDKDHGKHGPYHDYHVFRMGASNIGGGSGSGGGAVGGSSGGAVAGWAGDFDEQAAAADASRGKKIFSRTTAQTNMFALFMTGEDSSALIDSDFFKTPPRIWQYFAPTIVMPTISFPVNPFEEEPGVLDPSLGVKLKKTVKEKLEKEERARREKEKKENNNPKDVADDENKKTEKDQNGKKNEEKNGENNEKDVTRGTGKQAQETHEKWAQTEPNLGYKEVKAPYTVEKDLKKDLGRSFPIIYINDHMFSEDEIQYFKLDCMGFLPTIELHIQSSSKNIIKENLPKEGDTVGVFIQYTHTLIRPLRCDFQITAAITKEVSQEYQQEFMSMIVYGELKIPDLYNSDVAFEYQGSSRNALIDIAQKLKLGYCFNDPDDTKDAQSWYCTPEQSGDPATYIEDLATHLYKDSSSFYGAWIDPRYNLTVINIREMLGTTIDCDDGIDLTKMVSVINNNFFDGSKQDRDKSVLTPKLFNNFLGDQATDTYYVYDYKLINQASEISNKMGLLQHSNFGINATGLPASLTIEINPQLCLNWEKVEGVTAKGEATDARYIALTGPGINRNQNDNPPENGNYTKSKTKTSAATDINVQSDADAAAAKAAESNQTVIIPQEGFLSGRGTEDNSFELDEVVVVGTRKNANKTGTEDSSTNLTESEEIKPAIDFDNVATDWELPGEFSYLKEMEGWGHAADDDIDIETLRQEVVIE